MLQAASTPLSAMDPATMRAVFNYLAAERGQPLAPRTADRFVLGKGIALLRTMRPAATPAKPAPARASARGTTERKSIIRDAAVAELSRVAYYKHPETGEQIAASIFEGRPPKDEDAFESWGLTYFEVVQAIKRKHPKARTSPSMLRQMVHHIRVVAELTAAGHPVEPQLEGFRDVVLPDRRAKSGVKKDGKPKRSEGHRPSRASARRNRRTKLKGRQERRTKRGRRRT